MNRASKKGSGENEKSGKLAESDFREFYMFLFSRKRLVAEGDFRHCHYKLEEKHFF
jgi:hypothetical protein